MAYQTEDNETFSSRQEAQNHANGLGYKHEGDLASKLGNWDKAIANYNMAIPLLIGTNKGVAYMNRAASYVNKGNYDKAIEDCNAAQSFDLNKENLAILHNTWGIAYKRKGLLDLAITYWKLAADWGDKNALDNLAKNGVQYTPKSSSSSSYSSSSYSEEPRGVFLSIVFGLIGGVGLFTTFGWIYVQLGGTKTISSILLILLMIAIGTVITFLSWRNRWKLFFVIIPLALFGWLVAFGIIPERIVGIKSATTQTQTATATVNANVNFRKEPTTGDNIIRQLQQGDTVTLTGEVSGGWTQIKHNGDTGWISTEYLKK